MGNISQTHSAKDISMSVFNKKGTLMKKSAFTMIELVLVIVVLGILAALALPRLDRDLKQEAMDNILSNIRYTQHLAQLDNKHIFDNSNWQQRYWKIMFGTCTGTDRFFMIGSDDNMDSAGLFDRNESALDPTTGKQMFWSNATDCSTGGDNNISSQIFITKKYGINSFTFTNTDGTTTGQCATAQYIGFDNLGRPHVGFGSSTTPNQSSYMSKDCNITFNFVDTSITPFSIIVYKENRFCPNRCPR